MRIKGSSNPAYYVEARELEGGIAIICGNILDGKTCGVLISLKDWKLLKKMV